MPSESNWSMLLPASEVDGMMLADPVTCLSREIDVILGVDVLAKVFKAVHPKRKDEALKIDTELGLVILGNQMLASNETEDQVAYVECASGALEKALHRLWEMDHVDTETKQTDEEKEVERIFMATHVRDKEGRFVIIMPMKSNWRELGNSKDIALNRFYILERRLARDKDVKEKYVEFMQEYERLGHMQVVKGDVKEKGDVLYYIPHHCVTTKFRVVFDASCKTTSGLSLNDVQMLGEKLQRDLQDIVMRFRRCSAR